MAKCCLSFQSQPSAADCFWLVSAGLDFCWLVDGTRSRLVRSAVEVIWCDYRSVLFFSTGHPVSSIMYIFTIKEQKHPLKVFVVYSQSEGLFLEQPIIVQPVSIQISSLTESEWIFWIFSHVILGGNGGGWGDKHRTFTGETGFMSLWNRKLTLTSTLDAYFGQPFLTKCITICSSGSSFVCSHPDVSLTLAMITVWLPPEPVCLMTVPLFPDVALQKGVLRVSAATSILPGTYTAFALKSSLAKKWYCINVLNVEEWDQRLVVRLNSEVVPAARVFWELFTCPDHSQTLFLDLQ